MTGVPVSVGWWSSWGGFIASESADGLACWMKYCQYWAMYMIQERKVRNAIKGAGLKNIILLFL